MQKDPKEKINKIENFMTVGNTILTIMEDKERSQGSANENRVRSMWERGYRDLSNKKFKRLLRITRESFELILEKISMDLIETPAPMKPNPIPS